MPTKTKGGTYDQALSIDLFIRQCLRLPSRPVVIFLYLWDQFSWPFRFELQKAHAAVLEKYAALGMELYALHGGSAAMAQANRTYETIRHDAHRFTEFGKPPM